MLPENVELKAETHSFQSRLAQFCRSGIQDSLPVTSESRQQVYRDLVFHVIQDTLSRAYPIVKTVLPEAEWCFLIEEFFSKKSSCSPMLWKMPQSFCEFVIAQNFSDSLDAPWLDDLLRFEWLEIEVFMMPDSPKLTCRAPEDFWSETYAINLDYKVLHLDFPVFREPIKGIELKKGNYTLLVFRDPELCNVKFMEISKPHLEILETLTQAPTNADILFQRFSDAISGHQASEKRDAFQLFIRTLFEERALLGVLR